MRPPETAIRTIDPTPRGTALRVAWLALLIAIVALLPGIAQAQEDAAPEGDPVVIEVGETSVTQSEFDAQFDIAARSAALQQGLEPTEENLATFDDSRPAFLEQYATQVVLLQEAEARGISVSDDEVDAAVEQFRTQFESDAEFQEQLQQLGFGDEENLRANVRESLTVQALVDSIAADAAPTQDEVQAYYEANPEQFQSEEGTVPLEDVRPQIENLLVQQAVNERIEDIRAEADVQVFPENI